MSLYCFVVHNDSNFRYPSLDHLNHGLRVILRIIKYLISSNNLTARAALLASQSHFEAPQVYDSEAINKVTGLGLRCYGYY